MSLAANPSPPLDPAQFPWTPEPLEEVTAAEPADAATALGFALRRMRPPGATDPRPLALVTTALWLRERGRPFSHGLAGWGAAGEQLIWIRTEREAQALWALEEALKSGAVAGGLATVETPSLVATRRLDFAARAGGALGVVLRAGAAADLSAARRRWRITARRSGEAMFDLAAPGAARLRAELLRRRDGPPGAWDLEQDDETHGLRVVAGLAGHGLAARPAPAEPGRSGRAA
jgi:protein ImuA